MEYFNSRLFVPAVLLFSIPLSTAWAGVGEQPKGSVDERVKTAAARLQSNDEDQRLQAAVELLRLGKHAAPAVPQLIAVLKDSREGNVATVALGRIGEPAVKPLVVLLREGPEADRALPLWALSCIGPNAKEAGPVVRELLKSKDPKQVLPAAYTLARISPPDRPAALETLREMIKVPQADSALVFIIWLHPKSPDFVVTELMSQLRSQSCMFGELSRFLGAYGLAELGPAPKAAVPALREALSDKEPLIRALAAYALAEASAEDRPAAIRILREIASQKPGTASLEFHLLSLASNPSVKRLKPVERDAIEAVVDVLLTQEPGNHFPTSSILTWVKNWARQSDENVGEWLMATPLSTSVAGDILQRLESKRAK